MGETQHQLTSAEWRAIMSVMNTWKRQRDKGFDLEHDLKHQDGCLSRAAAAYALHGTAYEKANGLPSFWPWADGWNPKDRRANLERAAAFLLSEIVRHEEETCGGIHRMYVEERDMSDNLLE